MLSNPCACLAGRQIFTTVGEFKSEEQQGFSRTPSRRSKKYARKPTSYGLLGQGSSVHARNDGVVVVSQTRSRPKYPKVSNFDREQVHTWTTSQNPADGATNFLRFHYQSSPRSKYASSSASSPGSSTAPLTKDDHNSSLASQGACCYTPNAVQITLRNTTGNLQYRQTVLGFGAALTDAACINLNKLADTTIASNVNGFNHDKINVDDITLNEVNNNPNEPECFKLLPNGDADPSSAPSTPHKHDHSPKNAATSLDKELINCYVGPTSAGYQIIRTPISSCDFSARCYTYLDQENDFELESFALQPEDEDKIKWLRYMTDAADSCGDSFDLLASSWTAPLWMKTNGKFNGKSTLRGTPGDKYHTTWAKYLMRYLDEYKLRGLDYAYMTVQNEPSNGYAIPAFWQSLGWSASHMRDFIATDIYKQYKDSPHDGVTKILMLDDVRIWLPSISRPWSRPGTVLGNEKCAEIVSGIGVHWYMNWAFGVSNLDRTHEQFPDKFLLGTEACHEAAPMPASKTNAAEQWTRGEKYSYDIITSMNHWQTGWIDWNLCLDLEGGPNVAANLCDSPILVNGPEKEFYIQPMYFHMLHFSKLLNKGSRVVKPHSITNNKLNWYSKTKRLEILVAERADKSVVLTVLNRQATAQQLHVTCLMRSFTICAKTIQSILFFL